MASSPTAAAVSASISTPVWPWHSTVARISTEAGCLFRAKSTATREIAIGCASGISSGVRFAAWIAAIRATPSTSPFFARPAATRRKVAGFIEMRPEATATRRVTAFSPTSTMCAEPRESKWVNVLRPARVGMAGAIISSNGMLPNRGFFAGLVLALAALAPRAMGQPLPQQTAAPLPDLGGAGSAALSPTMERRLGESIMLEIRSREPSYVEDPEVSEYLGKMGARLSQVMAGARYDFEFFVIRDPSINAFALPGGFVGVHTGLVNASDTESELAAVLGHELSHVTQRHISRMFGQQEQMQIPVLAALAAALVLGMRRPDLAAGAMAATQGAAISAQLSYSRDFEREADRVGLDAMSSAGYDPRAMAVFFEKLQRATRVMDDGSMPGYLRSHPVTVERIADAQNKSEHMPYRQHLDSRDFYIVRAKLRAEAGEPREAVTSFRAAVRDKRYANETAARYGLTYSLVLARRPQEAAQELQQLLAAGGDGTMVQMLAARVKRANGDLPAATAALAKARSRYPQSRPIVYAYCEALQDGGRNKEAAAVLEDAVRLYPRDAKLHVLQAKTYAALGKRLLQHQAQAEYYVLQGSLPAAIEQLQLARTAGDGDFYQLSMVDARLKELRTQHQLENPKEPKR